MSKENQILSRHNFGFYHDALRDVALGHVVNEWGILGYPRLVFKMPNDSHGADFVMRAFPESYMVFMMRDGRVVQRGTLSDLRVTPAEPYVSEFMRAQRVPLPEART